MREIKFRAWGCHEVTYNWEIEDEYGFPLATYSKPSMIYVGLINGLDEMHHNPSKLKFMQYTGLKIKNQEVYEDDIIKARKDFIYKVVFENGSFVLQHLNKFADKENLRWGLLSRLFDADMQDILKECEVIGNIYENQELLES